MANKKNSQQWYQTHKRRAGEESIKNSPLVIKARSEVASLEAEVEQLRRRCGSSFMGMLRKAFSGPNSDERKLQDLEKGLDQARLRLGAVIHEAKLAGEKSYSEDWARRNPQSAKR